MNEEHPEGLLDLTIGLTASRSKVFEEDLEK